MSPRLMDLLRLRWHTVGSQDFADHNAALDRGYGRWSTASFKTYPMPDC